MCSITSNKRELFNKRRHQRRLLVPILLQLLRCANISSCIPACVPLVPLEDAPDDPVDVSPLLRQHPSFGKRPRLRGIQEALVEVNYGKI